MTDPLEKVIRPIVEGQIRGFIKEHPSILQGVDWYKPRKDKSVTLTNSLAKRIILDLLCKENRERIEAALFILWEQESAVEPKQRHDGAEAATSSGEAPQSSVALRSADDSGLAAISCGWAAPILDAVRAGKKPPTIIIAEPSPEVLKGAAR